MSDGMSDNTFWILFWLIVSIYFSIAVYFEGQTNQRKIEADKEISKLKEETNRMYYKAISTLNEKILEE